jgi:hypothetical protein
MFLHYLIGLKDGRDDDIGSAECHSIVHEVQQAGGSVRRCRWTCGTTRSTVMEMDEE